MQAVKRLLAVRPGFNGATGEFGGRAQAGPQKAKRDEITSPRRPPPGSSPTSGSRKTSPASSRPQSGNPAPFFSVKAMSFSSMHRESGRMSSISKKALLRGLLSPVAWTRRCTCPTVSLRLREGPFFCAAWHGQPGRAVLLAQNLATTQQSVRVSAARRSVHATGRASGGRPRVQPRW